MRIANHTAQRIDRLDRRKFKKINHCISLRTAAAGCCGLSSLSIIVNLPIQSFPSRSFVCQRAWRAAAAMQTPTATTAQVVNCLLLSTSEKCDTFVSSVCQRLIDNWNRLSVTHLDNFLFLHILSEYASMSRSRSGASTVHTICDTRTAK